MAATIVLAVTVGTLVLASPANADTVERVIDGDTLVVKVEGREERVRLLNINTPETKDPDAPVECLGPEAAEFTRTLLPEGTQVTLTYDVERRDRYGRLLAHVRLEDGRSVGEELAREGLGVPVAYGQNRSGLAPVRDSFREARKERVGFFDPAEKCTVPGQYAQAAAALQPAATPMETTSQAVGAKASAAFVALGVARKMQRSLRVPGRTLAWVAMTARDLRGVRATLAARIERRVGVARRLESRASSMRIAEEAARARRAEAAAAREAARLAAVQARARAAADEEARQRAAAAAETQSPDSDDGSSSDPYPGYTGPRCYAPGGQTWRPCP